MHPVELLHPTIECRVIANEHKISPFEKENSLPTKCGRKTVGLFFIRDTPSGGYQDSRDLTPTSAFPNPFCPQGVSESQLPGRQGQLTEILGSYLTREHGCGPLYSVTLDNAKHNMNSGEDSRP